MDATLKLWALIVIVGMLNYLSRLSFIALFANRHVPPLLGRAFRYVPAAMLTALIVPMVVTLPFGPLAPESPKIAAAFVAGVVAFVTHSQLKTLGSGMVTLWALQALAHRFG